MFALSIFVLYKVDTMSKHINPIKKAKLKESILKHPERSVRQHFLNAGYAEASANQGSSLSVLKCVMAEVSKEWSLSQVTVEDVLKKIEAGQALALTKKDYASYAFLVQLQGKYLAMFTDKQEIKSNITISDEDLKEVENVRRELFNKNINKG